MKKRAQEVIETEREGELEEEIVQVLEGINKNVGLIVQVLLLQFFVVAVIVFIILYRPSLIT
jgi:hypothetical protein